MYVFVWAHVVCGTRYYQSASVGWSQTIQKIHMRKIEVVQGVVHDVNVAYFMIRGRLTRENGSPGDQGCALTRNVARSHGSKNLLQRAILYRHKKIYHGQG